MNNVIFFKQLESKAIRKDPLGFVVSNAKG